MARDLKHRYIAYLSREVSISNRRSMCVFCEWLMSSSEIRARVTQIQPRSFVSSLFVCRGLCLLDAADSNARTHTE